MSTSSSSSRDLRYNKKFNIKKFLSSWEMILVYILIFLNIALSVLETDIYFSYGTIQFILKSGMAISFMVLGMAQVLLLGDIDVSVASVMILSSMTVGLVYQNTHSSVLAVLCGLLSGAVCGLINGLLTAKLKMPSVIVTIATSMLFRGFAEIVLNGEVLSVYPKWFSVLSWQDFKGVIPYSLICFIVFAVIFGIVLHKTKFGRLIYTVGNAEKTARYSGVRVDIVRIAVFVIMGITAAVSGVFFAGRLGGISSGMAKGYELNVIAIAVLGGVSTNGGKGKIYGPVIAAFIMEFLTKTLDLIGVHANVQKIIIGFILLIAVMIPVINRKASTKGR